MKKDMLLVRVLILLPIFIMLIPVYNIVSTPMGGEWFEQAKSSECLTEISGTVYFVTYIDEPNNRHYIIEFEDASWYRFREGYTLNYDLYSFIGQKINIVCYTNGLVDYYYLEPIGDLPDGSIENPGMME